MKVKKNVLIIAAHPDDEVLGCGGYIDKNKNSHNFKVIFLAEGSSCRYVDSIKNKKKIQKDILIRKNSANKALKILGVKKVTFYENECGSLSKISQINLNRIIEKEIMEFRPNIILTHSNYDLNLDHKAIFDSVLVSTRPGNFKYLETIFSFEILSTTEWNFEKVFDPNYFIELSKKNIMSKIKALNAYKSEVRPTPYPRSAHGIKTLAKYRGMQSGLMYAEAFKLIRKIT